MFLVISSYPSYATNWIDLQPVGIPKTWPSMASSMLMEPSVKVLVVLSMRLIFRDITNEESMYRLLHYDEALRCFRNLRDVT